MKMTCTWPIVDQCLHPSSDLVLVLHGHHSGQEEGNGQQECAHPPGHLGTGKVVSPLQPLTISGACGTSAPLGHVEDVSFCLLNWYLELIKDRICLEMERVEMSDLVQQSRTEEFIIRIESQVKSFKKKQKKLSFVENELIKGVLYSLIS